MHGIKWSGPLDRWSIKASTLVWNYFELSYFAFRMWHKNLLRIYSKSIHFLREAMYKIIFNMLQYVKGKNKIWAWFDLQDGVTKCFMVCTSKVIYTWKDSTIWNPDTPFEGVYILSQGGVRFSNRLAYWVNVPIWKPKLCPLWSTEWIHSVNAHFVHTSCRPPIAS